MKSVNNSPSGSSILELSCWIFVELEMEVMVAVFATPIFSIRRVAGFAETIFIVSTVPYSVALLGYDSSTTVIHARKRTLSIVILV